MIFPDTITVEVKQSHIDAGRRCDGGRCPVALALTEMFPECRVRVGGTVHISKPDGGAYL